MYLKRKIEEILLKWKEQSAHEALCIVGARQIGKSTAVRHFAQEQYECFIELNFITDPGAVHLFDESLDPDFLWTKITTYKNQQVIPGRTLLLLDEIQECPNARTAVKFLVEDGRAAIVETGSMLGVKVKEIRSYPVGFERTVEMYPLDLEEYLWNTRVSNDVLDYMKDCYEKRIPVDDVIHKKMLEVFREYMVVGGMPEAVVNYLETNDLIPVLNTQNRILGIYTKDIAQYADRPERVKILDIFRSIPSQLDNKNRRFMLSQVIPKAKLSRNEGSFLWLSEAGISLPCYNVSQPVLPLVLNEKRNLFKLFLCDTGLLCAASLTNIQYEILSGDLNINQGSILENMFAQQLKANGFSLYYYNAKNIGEIDFVCSRDGKVDLVEIKSGNDYEKHPALSAIGKRSDWQFGEKIVFCQSNIKRKDGILYLPCYCIQFYKDTVLPESLPVKRTDLAKLKVPDSWKQRQQ